MREVHPLHKVQVSQVDGHQGLISLLLLPLRRAAVLIDPPYEEKQDYRRVVQALKDALKRFETGCYMAWYLCLSREESRKLLDELKKTAPDNHLHAELHVHTPRSDDFGIHGSGILVINLLYMFAGQLQNNLLGPSGILAQDAGAYYVLESKTE